MSGKDVTIGRHDDFVGTDSNKYRIPGAEMATSGHHFIAINPGGASTTRPSSSSATILTSVRRPPQSRNNGNPTLRGRKSRPRPARRPLPSEILAERAAHPRAPSPPRHLHEAQEPLTPAPDSRTVVDSDPFAERTWASDTLGGATSADVHRGLGRPGGGMSSKEARHDGKAHRARERQGLEQYGRGEHALPRDEDDEE
ncbi:uncharacterized protein BXZ73DRAFT_42241 [Epithele typhae]|uniref:uncharacterized protein n=1 Tax=Epithele typhae TaxID=378194 RepID=UPI0020073088|nr:uncharacterized protein BXZ73DRAFT_42241 [Epithele typhae]KAH9941208.1 hypothetical protein BXZ73DRAFT_42241 [Epithele typhae]